MAWISTAIRLAPHALRLGEIAVSALPHLTRRKDRPALDIAQPPMLPEIAELQAAVTQNAEDIRKIADDLKDALIEIDDAGIRFDSRLKRLERIAYAALGLSLLAVLVSLALWLH